MSTTEKLLEQSDRHYSLEGESGVEALNFVTKELDYKDDGFRYGSSFERFLADNPGAVEAVLKWIDNNYQNELEELAGSDEDEDEDEEPYDLPSNDVKGRG